MGTATETATATATTMAATAGSKKVSGSLALTLANETWGNDLKSSEGKTGMQKMFRDQGGLAKTFNLSNIAVTVACAATRRLSVAGRRLSTWTGTVGYTITVPAGAASNVATSLNGVTTTQWKTHVQNYAAAEGKTVTPTLVAVITQAGVPDVNDASFAKSTSLLVGLMMIFRALL